MPTKYYNLGDPVPKDQSAALGAPTSLSHTPLQWQTSRWLSKEHGWVRIMAKKTDEKRAPKKWEWYISGALPTAYLARNDLSTEFLIAKLVRVRQTTLFEEV